ncbi:uncharacterized protein GVI51_M06963 [Nakaseomyces glabratus]|uniref:Late endosomal/lysosomal adaptor and MAPK and MTOR activator 5 n=2 Tax=Candida glabrata TaxID=5478 RepID=B4UN59_CANGA|nr:uncharacterized protein CAGL0M07001g [Nakaseomyces glabratus]KAH7579586.1 Protein of unknown function (DUF3215) [Nakaseomyces glabratus]KAH7592766.1 Protein of unknown function (DUF3215) [Nakaseomyces glabratus]KAH7593836.1 Protein of unknown function (DUF3215) [Nakaseomyces glabratus]KAH7600287.1 Protein of unknown function (DUF3215) [Nakaseomyces glabratus]KAH7610611.1 Protein of unknown function (DUF3215) [Nakaseomyces glabratus]|eukprot:XP_002999602.1 uncharacterized protein CAGL0M07001g [[Candida] glabrata]
MLSSKLQELLPGSVGVMTFDSNNNLVLADGVAKDKVNDIPELSEVQCNAEGVAVLENGDYIVHVCKKDGNTLVVYTGK